MKTKKIFPFGDVIINKVPNKDERIFTRKEVEVLIKMGLKAEKEEYDKLFKEMAHYKNKCIELMCEIDRLKEGVKD